MASCSSITTDATLPEVVEALASLSWVRTGGAQYEGGFPDDPTYYMVTENGGRMTVASDLKFDADEMETWIAVYEQEDKGLDGRLFDALAKQVNKRITLHAEDSDSIVREVNK